MVINCSSSRIVVCSLAFLHFCLFGTAFIAPLPPLFFLILFLFLSFFSVKDIFLNCNCRCRCRHWPITHIQSTTNRLLLLPFYFITIVFIIVFISLCLFVCQADCLPACLHYINITDTLTIASFIAPTPFLSHHQQPGQSVPLLDRTGQWKSERERKCVCVCLCVCLG